ncbi:IL-1 receptor-like protein [Deerpox virus W-848-83]|uniref:Soluble interferon alpha/beta receptor OPG204 n=1 Tax=Deerpox virus (strain Mule deer/United States/W-848-83/1983) TaxID=305674 RepID=Q08FY5_DPV83|nr:IL-1 receptor-like protein [Deerpox virus W-848-83]ABI99172.1 IL-1 receptor-like protein [Deerpox virus W-848-83]
MILIIFFILLQFINCLCLSCQYRGGDLIPSYAKDGDPMVLLCTGKHSKRSKFYDKTFITDYNVTWSKTDSLAFVRDSGARTKIKTITHNEIGDRSENLWIGNSKKSNEGIYICTISNGNICEESTIRFSVDSGLYNFQFHSGKDIKLACYGTRGIQTTFKDDYTLTWSFNGIIIYGTEHIHLSNDNSTLTINSATNSDSGSYVCTLLFAYNSNNYNITKEYKVTII